MDNRLKNMSIEGLVEEALRNREGVLAENGALVVRTGNRTGRSPKSRFIVDDAEYIDWNEINQPCQRTTFNRLWEKATSYLKDKKIYHAYGYVGADPRYRLNIHVIAQKAWHALFARTLFLRPSEDQMKTFRPQFTVLDVMDLKLNSRLDDVTDEVFIGLDLKERRILIIGSGYGGEIKKGVFTVMNYLLPQKGVLPMHCSANVGRDDDTALFFGLSGTGKTTLSADKNRRLIGDDEHGWTDNGIFNFEGGCYAKVIRLSAEKEPQIYKAIKAGSSLENVVVDENGRIDYDDASITENTRATYPIEHIPNVVLNGMGNHPRNIFFLACDAFGVLPPIAELTPEMAMYHFLSGYTAKVAGTEAGITEPAATFSACFGAPFMTRHPTVYARMLAERMKRHGTKLWLVNTGWSGGPYGIGRRMDIDVTRKLLDAALSGMLNSVEKKAHPVFKILVPQWCPGVDSIILNPSATWSNKSAYDDKAKYLASLFNKNFQRYAADAGEDIAAAGPST